MRSGIVDNRALRLALVLAALLVVSPLHARSASRASVDAMFAAMDMRRSWDDSIAAMTGAFRRQLDTTATSETLPPGQQRQIDGVMSRASILMQAELGWQSVGAELTQAYADVCTQEEIDAMNAFYTSPAGRAVMAKAPALIGTLMQQGGDFVHNDVLTPDESSALEAFLHSPATASMKAKMPLMREHIAQISHAHFAHARSRLEAILHDADAR